MQERTVKVCPRCGSKDFYTVASRGGASYACKGCAYRGTFVEVSNSEARKIKGKSSKYFSPFPPSPNFSKGKSVGLIALLLIMLGILIVMFA